MSLLDATALRQRLALHGSPPPRSTHGLATMARYDILLAPASPAAFAAHRLLDARDALLRHRLEVKAERVLQRMLLRENRRIERSRARHATPRRMTATSKHSGISSTLPLSGTRRAGESRRKRAGRYLLT